MERSQPTAGVLVVLEGIDGSGKTSLQRSLGSELAKRGYEVVLTKEPTEGPYGRRIREVAAGDREQLSAEEELELFHRDRLEHVRAVVRPALERGCVVLQDRSYFSTVAYQGERGLDRDELLRQSEAIAPAPDVLLVVDVPVDVALERIEKSRASKDGFELRESLERVRKVFLGFPMKTLIDGTAEEKEVLAQALLAIDPVLSRASGRLSKPRPGGALR